MEWKLIEHDTKYLMINQIPFSFYLEQAETALSNGAQIRKYLGFSIPDETDQQMFWQYLGYCMTTDTRFQKFLMLKGKGEPENPLLFPLFNTFLESVIIPACLCRI